MQMSLALMSEAVAAKSGESLGIFDAKANKLFLSPGKNDALMMVVRGEIDMFKSIWDTIECPERAA